MAHTSQVILVSRLSIAKGKLVNGGQYRHYRTGDVYTIAGFGVIEATEELAVMYKGEYDLIWVRTIDDFTAQVEHEGRVVSRFELISDPR